MKRWRYISSGTIRISNLIRDAERLEALTDFNSSYLVDKLQEKRRFIADNIAQKNDSIVQIMQKI